MMENKDNQNIDYTKVTPDETLSEWQNSSQKLVDEPVSAVVEEKGEFVANDEAPTFSETVPEKDAFEIPKVDAESVKNEPVYQVKTEEYVKQNVAGKTKVKKSSGMKRLILSVLAAMLIGIVIGGFAWNMIPLGHQQNAVTQQQSTKEPYVKTVPSSENNGVKVEYSSDGNMTIPSIAEVAVPAVVGVYNIGANYDYFGRTNGESAHSYGSGVVISGDGTIVTNYHVIEGATRVVVVSNDESEYEATVLGSDSNLDLAVLKINAKDLPYVDIGDSDKVKLGEMAVAIGNPVDAMFAQTVTDGIISGVDRKLSSESGTIGYLQTNASINSGNSGGALLNGQAQLIGINSMKIMSNGVEGMGFAIPSNVVVDFVNKVVSGEQAEEMAQKPWLGISGYSLNEEMAARAKIDITSGILIIEVTDAGPADQAGLQNGDVITGIDGKEIKDFDDLSTYLKEKAPGDSIALTIVRDSQSAEVTVTLGTQAQANN